MLQEITAVVRWNKNSDLLRALRENPAVKLNTPYSRQAASLVYVYYRRFLTLLTNLFPAKRRKNEVFMIST